MDLKLSAEIVKYEVNLSNQDAIIQILQTFEGWVLAESLDGDDILITDKRRGRNHLTIVRPGDYVVSFNNGVSGYVFKNNDQIYSAFGVKVDF